MTRTAARELAVRLVYALAMTGQEPETTLEGFFDDEHFKTLADEDELFAETPDEKQGTYIRMVVTSVREHREEIDAFIEKYSKGWKPERISKTASAILRCALCEILYVEDVPPSVAINEAVELAKLYDEPETVSFINGILGSFMRAEMNAEPPLVSLEETEA
ncbi:MAG: transcription antitermination factor NusB, partial [Oscillospiraceae bacterium]